MKKQSAENFIPMKAGISIFRYRSCQKMPLGGHSQRQFNNFYGYHTMLPMTWITDRCVSVFSDSLYKKFVLVEITFIGKPIEMRKKMLRPPDGGLNTIPPERMAALLFNGNRGAQYLALDIRLVI